MARHTVERGNVKNVDYTNYEEDIYVGYRYFDSFDVPVSYPFGYGLSYTTFEYSDAKIAQKNDIYDVTVTIKNTGNHEGKEVVDTAPELASFDEAASAWVVAEGDYQFLVGASSQDIKATLSAPVKNMQTKVNDVMKPKVQLNLLKR